MGYLGCHRRANDTERCVYGSYVNVLPGQGTAEEAQINRMWFHGLGKKEVSQ
jgi:hypothetical protein